MSDSELSASTAQLGDGWVQVADRLPKVGVPVQVFGKIPYGRTMRVLVAYRTHDWEQEDHGTPFWNGLPDHWDCRGLCGILEVSAWKPLSPPPNAEISARRCDGLPGYRAGTTQGEKP